MSEKPIHLLIKESGKSCILHLSEKQAEVIREACELLARLHMAQLNEMCEILPPERLKRANRNVTAKIIRTLQAHLFPELVAGSYYRLTNSRIPDTARIAFDLKRVIEHTLAGPRPEGSFPFPVYDEPRQTSETETLALMWRLQE